ncbi:MAG TPA: homogentisate 1,2-dioxygenase [Roseiflexaceae bacterium]|nr:homogentisate 1,2-dioxygenase [Roseiflexaceae bacterium]
MPFYHRLGELPHKRHTQFRQPDGSLYKEQVMGTRGFEGIQSIVYHRRPPTAILKVEDRGPIQIDLEQPGALRHRHFRTRRLLAGGDFITGRQPLLHNNDVTMSVALPTELMNYHYRNGQGDELIFVDQGEGRVESLFGTLPFRRGDYLVIPIGTTYRMVFDTPPMQDLPQAAQRAQRVSTAGSTSAPSVSSVAGKLLVLEMRGNIETPRRYRNEHGQLLEHSPYCERDIRVPRELPSHDEPGEFPVLVRARDRLTMHTLDHHPLDAVGWDGYLYPWTFNIEDFEPITGRVHQPPPVHQTFKGPNFVICSFVPRKYDYHPLAIPAPYNHSNVDSDEVLYYVEGNFMSRKGIEEGSISLHPSGLPHGPHPGAAEGSIGKQGTEELAVMMDTFHPLRVAHAALPIEDEGYPYSWIER